MQITVFDKDSITNEILQSSLQFSKTEFQRVVNECNPHLVLPLEASSSPESIEKWTMNLNQRSGRLYLCKNEDDNLMGLVFTYKKEETGSTHVWLVITGSNFRRCGVMSALFRQMEQYESANECNEQRCLTVNTIPLKFPSMPAALESQGFNLISTRQIDSQGLEIYSYKKELK